MVGEYGIGAETIGAEITGEETKGAITGIGVDIATDEQVDGHAGAQRA